MIMAHRVVCMCSLREAYQYLVHAFWSRNSVLSNFGMQVAAQENVSAFAPCTVGHAVAEHCRRMQYVSSNAATACMTACLAWVCIANPH